LHYFKQGEEIIYFALEEALVWVLGSAHFFYFAAGIHFLLRVITGLFLVVELKQVKERTELVLCLEHAEEIIF
jgi:hypothetical protein